MLEPKKDENDRIYYEQTLENREELYYKHFPEEKPRFYDLRKKFSKYHYKFLLLVNLILSSVALTIFSFKDPWSWKFIFAAALVILTLKRLASLVAKDKNDHK